MRVVLSAIRDKIDGLLITTGVGSLNSGVVPFEGKTDTAEAQEHTAEIDRLATMVRCRAKEEARVGEVVVIDALDTSYVGSATPATDFIDFAAHMSQRDGAYIEAARGAVESIQGECARAVYAYMYGPQFESAVMKAKLRRDGGDVVGMSGLENLIAAELGIPSAHIAFVTNGAFEKHTHEGNTEIGMAHKEKLANCVKAVLERWPELETEAA